MTDTDKNFYHTFLHEIDDFRHGRADKVAQPALGVYINTGMRANMEALRANYPGVAQLLGSESFQRLAGAFVLSHPPKDARLFLYGADLVSELSRSEGRHSLIATVARLDRYWTEVQAEADVSILTTSWISQQDGDALEGLALRPAPATRWLAHADISVWDWWLVLRECTEQPWSTAGGEQAVLLTRPDDTVLVHPLPPAGATLLGACDAGHSLQLALQATALVDPEVDLQRLLSTLFVAGAFQQPDQFTPRAFT